MSTLCKSKKKCDNNIINQGDIFKDITYIYKVDETIDGIAMTELTFPYSIVLSQSCDVYSINQLLNDRIGKTTKFMPSILMSPIFDIDSIRDGSNFNGVSNTLGFRLEHDSAIFTKEDVKVTDKDYHYRFHKFEIDGELSKLFEKSVIDFKQYFTVSPEYLFTNIDNRLCSLEHIFGQQITQKFATFLSRVGIP